MTLKNIVFFAAMLGLQSNSFAIGVYKTGDTLTIHAPSGLILREAGSPTGAPIDTLKYGTKVIVGKLDDSRNSFTVEEFPGYKINGLWVPVKTLSGKSGFVFDGYLSSYPTPDNALASTQNIENPGCLAEQYLMAKSKKKGLHLNLPKTGNQYENYRQLFRNGAVVVFAGGEGGSSQQISFERGISMEEAFLIGKALWFKGMKTKATYKNYKIVVKSEDELFQMEVENKGAVAVITLSHAD